MSSLKTLQGSEVSVSCVGEDHIVSDQKEREIMRLDQFTLVLYLIMQRKEKHPSCNNELWKVF